VQLLSISIAHIDSSWMYTGNEDYQGLLVEDDLTVDAFGRTEEVKGWIAEAQETLKATNEPKVTTGGHCNNPLECNFIGYCQSKEPQAEYPVSWLPRIQKKALKALIEEDRVNDIRKVPDSLLNELQLRVKAHTLSGKPYFDPKGGRCRSGRIYTSCLVP
jgi:hypothetical protein